jgi:enoyl-CoA hydratase/carnithine racemase
VIGRLLVGDLVEVEADSGVLVLRLNRPEQLNALSRELVEELRDAAAGVPDDPSVRVVVLTGAGRAFSAGADLAEALALVREPQAFRQMLRLWRGTFRLLEELPVPVVAAVNGIAFAGGLELALSCDVIVAAAGAALGDAHVRYGLVPGGGGSQRLVDAVGVRSARWLMYTGATVDARTAHHIGLVQHVIDDEDFGSEVRAVASN